MGKAVFLAGATSYTGRAVLAQPSNIIFKLHLRPDSPNIDKFAGDGRAAIVDPADHARLVDAMRGCDAVLSLIGTVRARFKKENVSYDSVDFGVNKALIDAAREAGAGHFILMSSVGAEGFPGPYMKAKRRAELYLIGSGLGWTIVRPSFLVGGERRFVPGAGAMMATLAGLPGIGPAMDDLRPIPIDILAWNYLRIIEQGPMRRALSGRDLWAAWRERVA